MSKTATSYQEGLKEDLSKAEEARAYLNAAIDDGNQEVFLLALRDVAEARGISEVARTAHLNRENVYRILSAKGNPQLSSLTALLHSVGLKLAVEMVRALGLPFGVVINRADVGEDKVQSYCSDDGIAILEQIPDDRRIAEAYSRGKMICEALPDYKTLFTGLLSKVAQGVSARAG